jgi:nucleotide-binding universal stress UspA family protein
MHENLVFVHSVDERGQFPDRLRPRLLHDDRPRLALEAQQLRQLGLVFDEELLRGVPDDGLVEFATKRAARLVVVGCTPTGAIERWLLGCTAEEIAESSPVPTLAVRSAAPFEAWVHQERPLKILVGMDLTANSDAALRWLGEFCQLGPCAVLAGHIADSRARSSWLGSQEQLRPVAGHPCSPGVIERLLDERVRRVLGGEHVRVCAVAGIGHVAEDLVTLARRSESDLLVVGTHQWKGLTRLDHRSVSRGVLRRATMNVLCVPEVGTEGTVMAWVGEANHVPRGSDPRPLLRRSIQKDLYTILPGGRPAKLS